jgi:uncharacterized protein
MTLLIGSCLALVAGPLLLVLAGARPWLIALLDGFVLVAVLGLVFFHIVPHAIEGIGSMAIVMALLGLVVPILLERFPDEALKSKTLRPGLIVLALIALAIHGIMDGAALVDHGHSHGEGEHSGGTPLGIGVLLHRIPLGLTLWWMLDSSFGVMKAFAAIIAMMIATVVGFWIGDVWMSTLSTSVIGHFQALMGGVILHVALSAPPEPATESEFSEKFLNRIGFIGACAGGVVITIVGNQHSNYLSAKEGLGFVETAQAMIIQSSPLILLAMIFVGFIHGFFFQKWRIQVEKDSSIFLPFKAIGKGLLQPWCSCEVVPFYKKMINSGLPLRFSIPIFLCVSLIGIDCLIVSIGLLGFKFTLLRLGASIVFSLMIGFWMKSDILNSAKTFTPKSKAPQTVRDKIKNSIRFGTTEYIDDLLPWFVLCLYFASIMEPVLAEQILSSIPPIVQILFAVTIGLPIYLGALGSTLVGIVLLHKGIDVGAVLAFLITASISGISWFKAMIQMHSKYFIATLLTALHSSAVIVGYLCHVIWGTEYRINLHQWSIEPSGVEVITVLLFACILILSLIRLGPRGFLSRLIFGIPSSVLNEHEPCQHGNHESGTH